MKYTKTLKALLLAVFTLVLLSEVQAQDEKAEATLTKLSDKMSQYESVSAEFEMMMVDKQADIEEKRKGSIKVHGDKYRLENGDILMVCDGKDIWIYQKQSNEVIIDIAEDSYEEEGFNPSDLFRIWETGMFKYVHAGESTVAGVNCEVVNLHPEDPEDKDYHTVSLFIDMNRLEMKRALIKGKQGSEYTFDLKSFNTEFIKSDVFTFNQAKYPGVEVIDNR